MTSYRNLSIALVLILTPSFAVKARSGGSASVTLAGRVSEFVAMTLVPCAQVIDAQATFVSSRGDGRTISLSISGSGKGINQIRIPLQVRSNTGYALSASVRRSGATRANLLVTGARSTGRFTSADAVEGLNISAPFDGRSEAGRVQLANRAAHPLEMSAAFLRGPRISRAGTSSSPDNAVEVTLLLLVEAPPDGERWTVELTLSALSHKGITLHSAR